MNQRAPQLTLEPEAPPRPPRALIAGIVAVFGFAAVFIPKVVRLWSEGHQADAILAAAMFVTLPPMVMWLSRGEGET